jgi:ribosome biogenesis GTPase / thiamine phosphate phosphatase
MEQDRLRALGWNDTFAAAFAPHAERGWQPARVALEHQHIYRLYTATGECLARVRGRLRHRAEAREAFPAVGDWVAITQPMGDGDAVIEATLPRRSKFSRKAAGDVTEEQIVAANIDVVFLVSGLDHDFNPRRIERYLVTSWDGGARPVILLNKADLVAEDQARFVGEVEAIAAGTPVHLVSTRTRQGFELFDEYLAPGVTGAFLGSSGVGKSTLINTLLGEERQRTKEVREKDQRGRHTTTHRELLMLPSGALLVDTPGMREMQLWEGNVEEAFDDIEALADGCQFRDCRHDREPNCAVRAAVDAGTLPAARLASFHKLQQELEYQATRQDQQAQIAQKRKWKVLHKAARQMYKSRE